jgi:CRISPR-associated protein Cas6
VQATARHTGKQTDEQPATMVDLAFALQGPQVPRDYRQPLAAALEQALPWLADTPQAGVQRLHLAAGSDPAVLAQRTRLVLRLPHGRCDDARALQGRTLDLAGHPLRVGLAQPRPLLPWGTLYAHLVATSAVEEADFVREVEDELQSLSHPYRLICGRHQTLEGGLLQGWSLMLDGLSMPDSLQLLQRGIGRHRRLGCGLFVAHKSAAAVGTAA